MATTTSNYQGFNLNPAYTTGSGTAYGKVPGQIAAPPSIFSQVNNAVPGAAGLPTASAADIGSELNGTLSQGTQNLLQNKAASMGVTAGQPGGLPGNTITNQNFLDQLGLTSEGLTHEGNQDYLSFLGGVGATQLNPNLLTDIASNNAIMASAPDPTMAANEQQKKLQQYFDMMRSPASGSGGSALTASKSPPSNGIYYMAPGTHSWSATPPAGP